MATLIELNQIIRKSAAAALRGGEGLTLSHMTQEPHIQI